MQWNQLPKQFGDDASVHGQVQLHPQTGAYTFTPNAPDEGERPYLGWDFFRVDAVEPNGQTRQQWIQLFGRGKRDGSG